MCAACWLAVRPMVPPWCACCGNPVTYAFPDTETDSGVAGQGSSPADSRCARCRRDPPLLAMSRALGEYQGELRSIIHAMKYGRHRSIAARLAGEMRRHCGEVLNGADAVVPVPLHWRRRWQRGFNQAELIAAGLGLPVWPALRRVRFTRPQVALPAQDRRRNLRGAFAIARGTALWASAASQLPGLAIRMMRRDQSVGQLSWRRVMEGAVVVIVDDVATTGSTLEACRRVLAEAGAREVRAVTAARVPGQR